jgi:hypothetical protein
MAASRCLLASYLVILASLLLQVGCSDDRVQPDRLLSVSLSPTDSTIFAGDALTYEAMAEYESGTRQPDSVKWTVSKPEVLSLTVEAGASATVTGMERGEGFVVVEVDDQLVDSAQVTVVQPGDVRWVTDVSYGSYSGPALDAWGRVFVVGGGNLTALSPLGEIVFSVPYCNWSELSGSVLPDGTAYTTGNSCVQRHASDGSLVWQFDDGGTRKGGVAVTSSGGVTFLDTRGLDLYRLSATGAEVWRTPIAESALDQPPIAPAIASNGDTYVPWDSTSTESRLSRVAGDGTLIWTVATSGRVRFASPALADNRIVLAYTSGGVAVFDTAAGATLWEQYWGSTGASSPVIDGSGNIYVQSRAALVSYDAGGTLRWSADLLASSASWGIGAPTLLSNGTLVVECGGEVCAVNASDGSLAWRSNMVANVIGSPAVAPDGTICVQSGEGLVALWGRIPPLKEGWPTEGGGMGRMRSQQ